MEDVRGKYVTPAIGETAFNCPHCGALAKQFWFSVQADPLKPDQTPIVFTADRVAALELDDLETREDREDLKKWAAQMASGRPFLHRVETSYVSYGAQNVSISRCFNCNDVCVWIYDQLLWPRRHGGPQPNTDLSEDVRRDYDEASTILDASPRGAAALLRLAIQKLCKELGESGENINSNIASLVRKGLDARVQKALDVVRVVGNDAVHPGQIDIRDDRSIAETLFSLVNLICEKMITEPKHVDAVYEKLPEEKRKAIEARDAPKNGTS